ncbi:unnamed protein product [Microthlaspi erraticum]|uniref:Uncharacterized protein n=1 Tax=Microthlaspi erraticum TaxID=1685480 RepID=A0A6D2KY96_9BRAS|nr:unnamed protein product [Microthlaspi erraticum]
MRIEGEKGVKTQSGSKYRPRTRKRTLAEQFSNRADRAGRAGKEWLMVGRMLLSRVKTVRAIRTDRKGIGRARTEF